MPITKMPKKNPFDEYPDDIFKDTRMSFGDHIEELRVRMIRGLKWLMLFLVIGFALDGIGQMVGNPRIGIGKPMLKVITEPVFGPPKPGAPDEIALKLKVFPGYISYFSNKGEALLEGKQYLTTLSVQEGFVVYFKVSILCGVVLASPFLLYQFWMFVGAGLYPHERKHIYLMFGPSLFLFLSGVLLCQFVVLPGAVKALLMFNEWLGFDPDIRLNEWLGLALILPLVFGVSFQTPLVMVFLNRIGMFSAQDYLSKWRQACMVLAVFSAVVTPTPDAVTMLYLFVPMFGLYMLGIVICYYFPGMTEEDEEIEAAEEVAV